MREQLVDRSVAGDDGFGRDRVEMVQALDELRRRKACGDLGGSGQSQDRERDRGLPTRGRELISGRAEGRILPRRTDQKRHVEEGERPAERCPTPLAPRRRWQQPVHTPIGREDAVDPSPVPWRHLRSLVQEAGVSQCRCEHDANAGPGQCPLMDLDTQSRNRGRLVRPDATAPRVPVAEMRLTSPWLPCVEGADRLHWSAIALDGCGDLQDRRIRPLCHPSGAINMRPWTRSLAAQGSA
jgi:hypothetical protein